MPTILSNLQLWTIEKDQVDIFLTHLQWMHRPVKKNDRTCWALVHGDN